MTNHRPLNETSCGDPFATASLESRSETALGRAGVYQFLALLFLYEPKQQHLIAFSQEAFIEAFQAAGILLDKEYFNVQTLQDRQEKLAVEYTRLFLLPGVDRVPPYASVHTPQGSGQLMDATTSSMSAYVQAAGFDYLTRELPDHIGVGLEFIAHVSHNEAVAWREGEIDSAINALDFQVEFSKKYLQDWVFIFLDKVEQKTTELFYQELVRFSKAFLQEDFASLKMQLDDAKLNAEK